MRLKSFSAVWNTEMMTKKTYQGDVEEYELEPNLDEHEKAENEVKGRLRTHKNRITIKGQGFIGPVGVTNTGIAPPAVHKNPTRLN